MLCLYVIGDLHSNLAALGSERSSMPSFVLRMFQRIGDFCRIGTDLRQRGVVHRGKELAGHGVCEDVLPNRRAG